MTKHNLRETFQDWDAKRLPHLEIARECAKRTLPAVFPDPMNLNQNHRTPVNFQSDGARFCAGLSGKFLQGVFPPGVPYAADALAPEIKDDPTVPVEWKQALTSRLSLQNMVVTGSVEQSPRYYANKLTVMRQLIIGGDTSERMNDDFSITPFRLDNYVTLRDSTGAVLCQVFKEEIDIASLTEDELASTGIKTTAFRQKRVDQRLVPKYTRNEWNPWSKKWVQLRAVDFNGKCHYIGDEIEDEVSAFWTTPLYLHSGESYGRSMCEENFGDLVSLDELSQRFLDFAELASWFKLFVDDASSLDERDLKNRNGSVHRGNVKVGQVQDVAMFQSQKQADFTVVKAVRDTVREALGRAFLSETGSVRASERTTLGEITKTTISELQNATAGGFASLAADQQLPQFLRARKQLEASKKIVALPKKLQGRAVRTNTLTGLAALAAQAQFQNVMSFADLVVKLGPESAAGMNKDVLLDVAMRHLMIDEPGLMYSPEEKQAKIDQALKVQAQAQANQQVIKSAGTIAEQQAAAPAQ